MAVTAGAGTERSSPRAPGADEAVFESAIDRLLPWRTRTAALGIGFLLLSYLIIDYVAQPEPIFVERIYIRVACTPFWALVALLSSLRIGQQHPRWVALLLSTVMATELSLVSTTLPAPQIIGFYPALLFLTAFLPMPRRWLVAVVAMHPLAFAVLHVIDGAVAPVEIVRHVASLMVASTVAIVAGTLALRQRRGEFAANQRIAEANRRLRELDRLKSDFFADVAHELRTPLAAALLALDDEAHPSAAQRPLQRLRGLIDDLLELSRIDERVARRRGESSDLAACCRALGTELVGAFRARSLTLVLDVPDVPAPVAVGRAALDRIVVNVLGHVLRRADAPSDVRVTLRSTGERTELLVADAGPPIPAEELSRIFDRSHRLGSAEGGGIGLALAHELAELHGGSLTCESNGGGTTFRAAFPRASEIDGAGDRTPRAGVAVVDAIATALDGRGVGITPQARSGQRPLALVVDGHAEFAQLVARALAATFDTVLAFDGPTALDRALDLRPQLVVTDFRLPGFDGLELVRRLRADPDVRLTPVLFASAFGDREHVLAALRAGAEEYVVKPFDREVLRARAESLLALYRLRMLAAESNRLWGAACEALALALDVDSVSLVRPSHADDHLELVAHGGRVATPPDFGPAGAPWIRELDGARMLVADGLETPGLPAEFGRIAFAAAAPLRRDGQLVGLLLACDGRPRSGNAHIVAALGAAATDLLARLDRDTSFGTLAVADDERRRLVAAILRGQESERRRLARELHDGTGQVLSAALLHLGLGLDRVAEESPARARLAQGRDLVKSAIEELRSLSRDLHPPTLSQLGLRETLRVLAAGMSAEGFDVDTHLDEPLHELPADVAINVYRMAQEALQNALKHARATHAVVRLHETPDTLILEVEDDGIGFVVSETAVGVGLISLRERAASIGGTVDVASELDHGTRVRATIPLSRSGMQRALAEAG